MPVCLRQGQAVNIPRPFMENLYVADVILQDGIQIEVAPEGRPRLPRVLCSIVRYTSEK